MASIEHAPAGFRADPPGRRAWIRIRRFAGHTAIVGFLTLLAACGSGTPSDPGPDDDPDGGPGPRPGDPDPTATLECEIDGFPCSFSDVSPDVLERMDSLADEALAMLDSNATSGEVAAWLAEQDGMAEVEWDETAIWFRVEDGRGVWVLREAAFSPPNPLAVPGVTPTPHAPRTSNASAPRRHVASEASEAKQGLVLSPFLWEFGEYDAGVPVAEILAGARGYEGGVDFQANEQAEDSEVGVDSFRGWQEHEVVFVNTHGGRVCGNEPGSGCRGTMLAGTLEGALPPGPGSLAEKLHELEHIGVDYIKSERTGEGALGITADFFRHEYEDGLDDALVYFSWCQSSGPQTTDLVDAIQGENTVVFGWTETVYTNDSKAAAEAIFEGLAERGYPAEVALDHIGELSQGAPYTDEAHETFPAPELVLTERKGGGDLRIREVVRALHPHTGEELTGGETVGIQGSAGDGISDGVPFRVEVAGVKPELAGEVVVHLTIDGVDAEPRALVSGEGDGDDRWTVSGVLDLGYDLESDRTVDVHAWAELHDEGVSRHESSVTLSGNEPIMGRVWELQATRVAVGHAQYSATPYHVSTTLTLTFADGQDPQEPHPRYEITGGTVTYDYNYEFSDCSYSAPVATVDVADANTAAAHLTFDTTTHPVRYSGAVYTYGIQFTYTESCESGTRTRNGVLNIYWVDLPPSAGLPVSPDGTTITGSSTVDGVLGTVETDYTITRVD